MPLRLFLMVQEGLSSKYFKKAKFGPQLFNSHRILQGLAFVLAIIAMIIIATTEEAEEGVKEAARHVIYGITLLAAAVIQIAVRVLFPVCTRSLARKGGRADR